MLPTLFHQIISFVSWCLILWDQDNPEPVPLHSGLAIEKAHVCSCLKDVNSDVIKIVSTQQTRVIHRIIEGFLNACIMIEQTDVHVLHSYALMPCLWVSRWQQQEYIFVLFYTTSTAFVIVIYRGVMRWLDAPLSRNVYAETFVNMTDVRMHAATIERLDFNHFCICALFCALHALDVCLASVMCVLRAEMFIITQTHSWLQFNESKLSSLFL